MKEIIGFESIFSNESDLHSFYRYLADTLDPTIHIHSFDSFISFGDSFGCLPDLFYPHYFVKMADPKFWAERYVLHVYFEEHEVEDIDYYADYLNSSCKMIILLYDVGYLEVYCKDCQLLKKLINHISKYPDVTTSLKTEGNDPRYRMFV